MRVFSAHAAAAALVAVVGAGCGLNVQSPDLFVLNRTGPGASLSLLVNDSGTISCNGGTPHPLADPLLLQARDLATSLDNDAKAGRRFAGSPHSIYRYTIRLQDGTLSFPDTAAGAHQELAQAELFTLQAQQSACNAGKR